MSKLSEALNNLPDTSKKVLAVLSGGLDSSVVTMLLVEKYGAENVVAVSYDYGQKQVVELEKAFALCNKLGIKHRILDLKVLGDIARPMSANIGGTNIDMPTIQDVLGDPQPPTYVPFRNLIMLSMTLSLAEVLKASHIFTGLQVHDECYNPVDGLSCGTCPTCAERIMNFIKTGREDPIDYVEGFDWFVVTQQYI